MFLMIDWLIESDEINIKFSIAEKIKVNVMRQICEHLNWK